MLFFISNWDLTELLLKEESVIDYDGVAARLYLREIAAESPPRVGPFICI